MILMACACETALGRRPSQHLGSKDIALIVTHHVQQVCLLRDACGAAFGPNTPTVVPQQLLLTAIGVVGQGDDLAEEVKNPVPLTLSLHFLCSNISRVANLGVSESILAP